MPILYQYSDGSITYDVDMPVGVNTPNRRDDVKLVQFMLREIYSARFATPPSASLAVDGWIGPTTIGWIMKFQKDVNAKGHLYSTKVTAGEKKCSVDGRVDAVKTASGKGAVEGYFYTISWMNTILKKLNPSAHAAVPTVTPCTPGYDLNTRPNPYQGEALVPETGGAA